jgi:hypothetical protein
MMSLTEDTIASNDVWSEGAFHAAEAGLHAGIDQLGVNVAAATAPIPATTILATINGSYGYRSGGRAAGAPQPLSFIGTTTTPGYSIGLGTGYNNPQGYVFYVYQINATGTGPRGAVREVESQAAYGPVPR